MKIELLVLAGAHLDGAGRGVDMRSCTACATLRIKHQALTDHAQVVSSPAAQAGEIVVLSVHWGVARCRRQH